MSKLILPLIVTACVLHLSSCVELGLAHRHGKVYEVNETVHLKVYRDGFMLDDDFEEGESTPSDTANSDKTSADEIYPMLDPEADSELIEKFGDFAILKSQLMEMKGNSRRSKRLVVKQFLKWEDGVIPYVILDKYYSAKQINLIHRGMAHWENYTCIRFVKRSDQFNYITIYPGNGCSSFIGMSPDGPQGLSLGATCFSSPGTVVHELGHAIGFLHEHSRPDRDDYIRINYENILPGHDHTQFDSYNFTGISTQGLPYDYNSIMHYNSDQSAVDPSRPTIQARDPNIIVGRAIELSDLDKIRANKYYNCTAPFPNKTTDYAPLDPPETTIPPRPYACGALIMGKLSGNVSTPKFPLYEPGVSCSWQIIAPEGYWLKITITSFGLKETYGTTCSDGNVTFLQLDHKQRHISTICMYETYYDEPYYIRRNSAHIMYRSGPASSSDPSRGFSMSFIALDINECVEDTSKLKCSHKCINTPGGYACACNQGYFLSADGHTCFDINECLIDDSLCAYKCKNFGGHYKCICPDGRNQTGHTCGESDQDSEQPQTSEAVSVETTEPLTTVRPTTATSPITTVAPTTRAPTVPPVVVRVLQLTQSEGTFSAPRWPRSYPQNIDYHWEITCAKDHIVQIDFSQAPFGIAGQMPNCSVDWIEVRNKNNIGSVLGRFCGLNVPPVVSSASNVALVSFHAGPVHSSVYKGFNASYKCVSKCPSIEIPKTMPECGGYLKGNSGMITSPNYPVTYNRNEYCEWIIEVPDCHKAIEINFVSFSVAGRMPDCPKDRLFVDDGLEKSSNSKGPFCHLTTPEPITTTSNVARLRFNAGPKHGPRRTGFSLRFQAIDK